MFLYIDLMVNNDHSQHDQYMNEVQPDLPFIEWKFRSSKNRLLFWLFIKFIILFCLVTGIDTFFFILTYLMLLLILLSFLFLFLFLLIQK